MNDNSKKICVAITGTGSYAPEKVLTNADLEKFVDTTDEWITSRTGIKERHVVDKESNEATSDMAYHASLKAVEAAGISAEDIDLIICGTTSPDYYFPSSACLLQQKLGAVNAFCMDLAAACSGFIFSLDAALQYLNGGRYKTALVIGADTITNFVNWEDRTTCVLFGDGAGAVILQAQEERGIVDSVLGSDGRVHDLLMIQSGGSKFPSSAESLSNGDQKIKMSGKDVFKHAVTNMSAASLEVLEHAGWSKDEIDWVIPHQANLRIISAIQQRLELADDQMIINVDRYGNTSAASIGLAMDEAVRDGRIKKGDKVLLVAFGAGFTWGALALEWSY